MGILETFSCSSVAARGEESKAGWLDLVLYDVGAVMSYGIAKREGRQIRVYSGVLCRMKQSRHEESKE